MGETKAPHFYDFGIWGRAQTPQNQLFLPLETLGHFNKSREITGAFKKPDFIDLKIREIYLLTISGFVHGADDEIPGALPRFYQGL